MAAQDLQLSQVTKESQIVNGRPYLLYYVSNAQGCYVEAEQPEGAPAYFSVTDGHKTESDKATYYLIDAGSNTWKIKSKTLQKYFPEPTAETNNSHTFTPCEEASAGAWTLNFLEGGTFAPSCNVFSLNRYNSVLHGWTLGTANVNQFKLYEWVAVDFDASKVYKLNNGAAEWVFVPAGGIYYYLYKIGDNGGFTNPSASGDCTYRNDLAIPLRVVKQDDNGHFRMSTKDGTKTIRISNVEDFTISEAGTSAATVDYSQLMGGLTPVANTSKITDGWYALRIKEDSDHPEYVGNFLYTLDEPFSNEGEFYYPYPVAHGGTDCQHPAKNDATYYFRLWKVKTENNIDYYHWQLPNGIYIVNYKNNYPIRYHRDLSDFIIGSNEDNTYYIQSSGYRTKAFDQYIGKTAHKYEDSSTKLAFYKVDLNQAGLTPWRVDFEDDIYDVALTYTKNDVKGSKKAYNGGYFFFPNDVTPLAGDFQLADATIAVDGNAKTITVTYAPDKSFTADDVKVVQGSRTTGIGNTKQVLLRVEVKPQAPCTPTAFTLTLSGAEQLSAVEAYMTTADQLHASVETLNPLGTTSSFTDENVVTINVTTSASHRMLSGETYFIWITASIINSAAAESGVVDAAISSISYVNAKNPTTPVVADISAIGDPEGDMRIFKQQSFVWVSAENDGSLSGTTEHYYRSPAILALPDGSVLAFCDYRYDNPNDQGKDVDGSEFGHRMDVLVRKGSYVNNVWTWGTPVTIAEGTAATQEHPESASGYAGPAVVRTNGGKIICLMASGQKSFDKGLKTVAMSTSNDNGASWSNPSEITINWGSLNPTSYYVTPGKGLAYSDDHVAFVINAKVGGKTKEYLLYSTNADFITWTVDNNELSGKGKESKLQLKNDDNLLVMGKTPASKDCNNDLLYFKRTNEGNNTFDLILQTAVWRMDGEPRRYKDMRLYASYDLANTWKQLFYIQPGNCAGSAMQKLSNDDLAIFFEDGSIGNNEKDGCYALNYVVIGHEMVERQSADQNTATIIATPTENTTNSNQPNVSGSGWTKSVTTNANSGIVGITILANHTAFNREWNSSQTQRYFDLRPSTSTTGTSDVISIMAPPGYVIQSYSVKGISKGSNETFTLANSSGSASVSNSVMASAFGDDNVNAKTATFTVQRNNSGSSYILITDFTVTLTSDVIGETLHVVNENEEGNSYATLYSPYNLTPVDDYTKAYIVTGITIDGKAQLAETAHDGRDIPKNTPVLLVNSQGSTYASFTYVDEMVQETRTNLLVGTQEQMTFNMATHSNWYLFGRRKLGTVEGNNTIWGKYVAGFYNSGGSQLLHANRAYLDTSLPAGASRGFDLPFDAEATGVKEISAPEMDDSQNISRRFDPNAWFTLDGRRLSSTPNKRGIYVKNGKKIVIK